MKDHHCVDCMNFLTTVVYKKNLLISKFRHIPKVVKAVKNHGRARVHWCRKTGAVYLNTHRIYELKACDMFDDANAGGTLEIRLKIGPEMADF